jgi:hypothetical protein
MSFGSSNSNTTSSSGNVSNNQYDPDRAYMQQLLAYEMYGPQGTTGAQETYYDPTISNNPMYSGMPSWDWGRQPNGPPDNTGPSGGYGTGNGPYSGPSWQAIPVGDNPNAPVGDTGGGGSLGGRNPDGTMQGPLMPTSATRRGTQPNNQAPGDIADNPQGNGQYYTDPGANNNVIPGQPNPNGSGGGIPVTNNSGRVFNANFGATQPGRGAAPTVLGSGGMGPLIRPGYGTHAPVYGTNGTGGWGTGGASGNANLTGGNLYNAFNDMVQNPDLDQKTKDAITVGANQAANAQYDSAEGALSRYGRTTGNRAGNAAATAQLAMDRANTAADTNRQNLIDFEQMRRQRQSQGLQGESGLYNQSNQNLHDLFGARTALDSGSIGRNTQSAGNGNYIGSNFGFSIG